MIAKKKKIEYIMKTNTYAVYLYGSAFSVRIIFFSKCPPLFSLRILCNVISDYSKLFLIVFSFIIFWGCK